MLDHLSRSSNGKKIFNGLLSGHFTGPSDIEVSIHAIFGGDLGSILVIDMGTRSLARNLNMLCKLITTDVECSSSICKGRVIMVPE